MDRRLQVTAPVITVFVGLLGLLSSVEHEVSWIMFLLTGGIMIAGAVVVSIFEDFESIEGEVLTIVSGLTFVFLVILGLPVLTMLFVLAVSVLVLNAFYTFGLNREWWVAVFCGVGAFYGFIHLESGAGNFTEVFSATIAFVNSGLLSYAQWERAFRFLNSRTVKASGAGNSTTEVK